MSAKAKHIRGLDPKLTIGIASVDTQHRDIIAILNRLSSAPESSPNSESITESLSELGTILGLHFLHEERYLRDCGMPGEELLAHLKRHDEILEQFVELNLEALDGNTLPITEIVSIVKAWAVDHVVDYDLRLRDFITNNPAK
jgi:hemerythrin-like metal-binding protein